MSTAKETIERKKEYAKLLYTVEGVTTQKELAERVGVSKVTINKWVNGEKWESLRASVIITKENELRRLYAQVAELNDHIMLRDPGFRFANSKEADVLVKLTASIKQMETETSAADAIEVLKNFVGFVRQFDYEQAKAITNVADGYIKSLLK